MVANDGAPDAALQLKLAAQMEAQLQTHVLDVWFPRAMDLQRGGFHQNFSQNWTREQDDARAVED